MEFLTQALKRLYEAHHYENGSDGKGFSPSDEPHGHALVHLSGQWNRSMKLLVGQILYRHRHQMAKILMISEGEFQRSLTKEFAVKELVSPKRKLVLIGLSQKGKILVFASRSRVEQAYRHSQLIQPFCYKDGAWVITPDKESPSIDQEFLESISPIIEPYSISQSCLNLLNEDESNLKIAVSPLKQKWLIQVVLENFETKDLEEFKAIAFPRYNRQTKSWSCEPTPALKKWLKEKHADLDDLMLRRFEDNETKVTVFKRRKDNIRVKLHSPSNTLKEKIKKIEGSFFDPSKSNWVVPFVQGMNLVTVLEEYKSEVLDVSGQKIQYENFDEFHKSLNHFGLSILSSQSLPLSYYKHKKGFIVYLPYNPDAIHYVKEKGIKLVWLPIIKRWFCEEEGFEPMKNCLESFFKARQNNIKWINLGVE